MKKEELIKAIEEHDMLNEQMYFVTENKGVGFLPVILEDNRIFAIHDPQERAHMVEKITRVKCTGKDFIEHLKGYTNNLDLFVDTLHYGEHFLISGFDFEIKEAACIYLDDKNY